jgi:hypothetical protein
MERRAIEARLSELNSELVAGKRLLAEHEAETKHLRSQLLRISGAIRVLHEFLGTERRDEPVPSNGAR